MTARPSRPRVIIDCDPGHDDALAIMVAACHTEILGITTVSGNAPLHHTTRNALRVAELCGLHSVPVHAGADRALVAPGRRHAEPIHGATGLDGPPPSEPSRRPDSDDAVAFIIDTVRARPDGEVWLVPVGPLTNVALALRRAPDLADRLAGMSFMGGSATSGNVTPTAEFNVWADPEAAAVAVGAGVADTRMAGLNLTRQFCVDDAFLARLRPMAEGGNAVALFCAEMLAYYLDRQEAASGRRLGPAHDVCAVLAITHNLIRSERYPVAVELHGEFTRAMTIVDTRPGPAQPRPDRRLANVSVGMEIDAAGATAVLLAAIGACGGGSGPQSVAADV